MGWREFYMVAVLSRAVFGQVPVIPSDCAFSSLEQAIQNGGNIQLQCPGPIFFTHEIDVRTNVSLSGAILTGNKATRLFRVEPGVHLQLNNLTIQEGYVSAGANLTNAYQTTRGLELAGTNVYGGAILNLGGTVTLSNCTVWGNSIRGGDGGRASGLPPVFGGPIPGQGGGGFGGAIMSSNGVIQIESCLFHDNQSLSGNGGFGGGVYPGPPGDCAGGAIYLQGGQLTIANSMFAMNQVIAGQFGGNKQYTTLVSLFGGAVAIEAGQAVISNCRFLTNSVRNALANGGAVYAGHSISVVIANSEFHGNSAVGGVEDWYFPAVVGYSSARGGAIHLVNCFANIDSIFCSGNSAIGGQMDSHEQGGASTSLSDAYGGALFCDGFVSIQKSSFFTNICTGPNGYWDRSTTSGNGQGGAIYNVNQLTLANCTFYLNAANAGILLSPSGIPPSQFLGIFIKPRLGAGGALANAGTASLAHCTFVANSASSWGTNAMISPAIGGAITNAGTLTLAKSILSNSSSNNYAGTVVDGGENLSSDATPKFSAASSRNSVDPLVGPFRFYRGRTPTIALLAGSPAIDAATPSTLYPTDQRNEPRPFGSRADIGAYEVTAAMTNNVLEIDLNSSSLSVSLFGQPGGSYIIYSSSNPVQWAPLATNLVDNLGRAQITAPRSFAEGFTLFKALPVLSTP